MSSTPTTGQDLPRTTEGDRLPFERSSATVRRPIFATIVRLAVGLLLLTSAGFKIYAIFTAPYFADSILGSPLWMVAIVECEVLLGLWLLSGFGLRVAWLVALIAFVGFAGVNTYLLATGATTCGCFGTVETHPWVMLGLDLAVLVSLVIWRPRNRADHSRQGMLLASPILKSIAIISGMSAIMLGLVGAWLIIQFGSLGAGIMAIRGETVAITPANFEVGEGTAGESRLIKFVVSNRLDQPLRILGGTTSCKCVATVDLPTTVPPNSSLTLRVRVRFSGAPGPFRQQFVLWTDSADQSRVLGRVAGVIIPNESS